MPRGACGVPAASSPGTPGLRMSNARAAPSAQRTVKTFGSRVVADLHAALRLVGSRVPVCPRRPRPRGRSGLRVHTGTSAEGGRQRRHREPASVARRGKCSFLGAFS